MALEDHLQNLDEETRNKIKQEVDNERSSYLSELEKERAEKEKVNNKNQETIKEKQKLKEKYGNLENEDIEALMKLKEDKKFQEYNEDFKQYGFEGLKKKVQEELEGQYKSSLEEKDNEKSQIEKERDQLTEQLRDLTKNNIVNQAANQIEDLQKDAQSFLRYMADNEFELDENGEQLVMKNQKRNSKGDPITFEEYLASSEAKEKYGFLFQGKQGAGVSGGAGSSAGGKMTPEQVSQHLDQFGSDQEKVNEYERLKKEGMIE